MMKKGKIVFFLFVCVRVLIFFFLLLHIRILVRRLNGIEQDKTHFLQRLVKLCKPFKVRKRTKNTRYELNFLT